jgi:hypothetical protein
VVDYVTDTGTADEDSILPIFFAVFPDLAVVVIVRGRHRPIRNVLLCDILKGKVAEIPVTPGFVSHPPAVYAPIVYLNAPLGNVFM